jgi:hypothetical protein
MASSNIKTAAEIKAEETAKRLITFEAKLAALEEKGLDKLKAENANTFKLTKNAEMAVDLTYGFYKKEISDIKPSTVEESKKIEADIKRLQEVFNKIKKQLPVVAAAVAGTPKVEIRDYKAQPAGPVVDEHDRAILELLANIAKKANEYREYIGKSKTFSRADDSDPKRIATMTLHDKLQVQAAIISDAGNSQDKRIDAAKNIEGLLDGATKEKQFKESTSTAIKNFFGSSKFDEKAWAEKLKNPRDADKGLSVKDIVVRYGKTEDKNTVAIAIQEIEGHRVAKQRAAKK